MIKAAVIDDDPVNVHRIKVALGRRGINVLSIVVKPVDGLEDVAERIRGFDPEFLFADYQLFDWTGADLIRCLEFPRDRVISTSRRHAESMRPMSLEQFLLKEDLAALCSASQTKAQRELAEIVARMIERTTVVNV